MPTVIVYRDGKSIRTTTLTADQAASFIILSDAVRAAQNVMRSQAGTVSHKAGVLYGDSAPDDIYAVLPRLAEIMGKHARAVYSHLDQAINGDVLRNTDSTAAYGNKLAHKNMLIPDPYHRAAALADQASTLGMTPLDGLAFERAELTDPAPAGSGAPIIRAFVRWHA